jgi:hypothetical protein
MFPLLLAGLTLRLLLHKTTALLAAGSVRQD